VGNFIEINLRFNMVLNSISFILNFGKSYQESMVSYKRIIDILDEKIEHNGTELLHGLNDLQFKNVTFSYDKSRMILNNFNCNMSKGKVYCIKGKNGSGKSTFICLMLGLFQDYNGQILINSKDIKDIDLYKLREKFIGVIEQESNLLNDTIRVNLTYGFDNNVSEERINKWIEKLSITEFINKLPDGINSNIFERAGNISGGEKQKISLVRTFLKDPDVFIFDEPTSALDVNSKELFLKLLDELKKNRIIILITHDYDIIESADEVILFD